MSSTDPVHLVVGEASFGDGRSESGIGGNQVDENALRGSEKAGKKKRRVRTSLENDGSFKFAHT